MGKMGLIYIEAAVMCVTPMLLMYVVKVSLEENTSRLAAAHRTKSKMKNTTPPLHMR